MGTHLGLGIILAPYGQVPGAYPSEIAYSYGGDGTFLCPDDPSYNTRGEAGMYYDTQLGAPAVEYPLAQVIVSQRPQTTQQSHQTVGFQQQLQRALQRSGLRGLRDIVEYPVLTNLTTSQPVQIQPPVRQAVAFQQQLRRALQRSGMRGLGHSMPTDFEIAPAYGYTPDMDGWVVAKEGFNPGSWIPPNGYSPSGAYGPPMAPATYTSPGPLGYLADDSTDDSAITITPTTTPGSASDVVVAIQTQNQKMFTLSLITTIAVTVSAFVATYRTAKQIRQLHQG